MILKSKNSTLKLSDESGSIISYIINNAQMCAENGEKRPLFILKLLKEDGSGVYCSAFDAKSVTTEEISDGYVLKFSNIKNMNIDTIVTVKAHDNGSFGWHLSGDNNSGMILEWIDFPGMAVPDTLTGNGGDYELFWPAMEGMIIEDASIRDGHSHHYREIGGQTGGYCGFYPGACPMQFMAYYNGKNGLYFAAHDPDRKPKTIEFHKEGEAIVLETRLFASGATGHFDMGYDVVTASFEGDWHDAAEIYRSWMEKNIILPKKLYENDLPKWVSESPLVVLYPIRGTVDHGDMTPNMYYPYKNILPITDEFSKKTESTVMALPMHWEGTAPWATPYVWPPYGGEEEFTGFVSALHEQGNLAGVYCSGIGWTTKSFLNLELDFSDKYDETLICRTPVGTIEQSRVIGEPIRLGYDMCPESSKVADIVSGEVMSIAKSGCDYAQYFDQNLGGEPSFCYAKDHGHPPAPGKWQNDAIERVFRKVHKDVKDAGYEIVIGCEGAAAEPHIGYLPFNDLRYNIGYFYGKPVPAYAYLFHEYLNNFMGNQNSIHNSLALDKNPDCVLFRMAYSFMAGDMLTVALGDKGQIHWGWDVPWDVPVPEQEPIFEFVKNLNYWRREFKDYLHYGKMVKPLPLSGVDTITLKRKSGTDISYPSLLTSRWKNKDGKKMQVIVNPLKTEQKCKINAKKVYTNDTLKDCDGNVTIPPLSAVWVE